MKNLGHNNALLLPQQVPVSMKKVASVITTNQEMFKPKHDEIWGFNENFPFVTITKQNVVIGFILCTSLYRVDLEYTNDA